MNNPNLKRFYKNGCHYKDETYKIVEAISPYGQINRSNSKPTNYEALRYTKGL